MRFAWQHQQDPTSSTIVLSRDDNPRTRVAADTPKPRYDRKIDDEDEEEYDDENETLNRYETLG